MKKILFVGLCAVAAGCFTSKSPSMSAGEGENEEQPVLGNGEEEEDTTIGKTNRVVWVDENNNISTPNAVASAAEMASARSQAEMAAAEQRQAEAGYASTTNLLHDLAASIANRTATVFYSLEMESFDVAVVFDEDKDKVNIIDFKVTDEIKSYNIDGVATDCRRLDLKFAFTANLQTVQPEIQYSQVLDGNSSQWGILMPELVEPPSAEAETYERDGTEYNYVYSMSFYLPEDRITGFVKVRIPNDAAAGDGSEFNITGDAGGLTAVLTWGGNTLNVVKGRIMMQGSTINGQTLSEPEN